MEKKKIGELLVEGGWVTPGELEAALEAQKERGERIGKILIDLGYLTEQNFLDFLSMVPSTPSIDVSGCEIEQQIIDLVPDKLARRLELVPISRVGKVLTVGMVCPLDESGKQELEQETGLKIRAVLCSRAAVFSALHRYYGQPEEVYDERAAADGLPGVEGSLKLRDVAQLVEHIEELPTLPEILHRVSAVVKDPKSSSEDLAKVIVTDAALSGKILKLANSPAYGFSRKISDVQQAITLIGFNETQNLAISVAVLDGLGYGPQFDFRAYWKHSLSCATLARLISLNLKVGGMESAFVSGLLHDMGKVILAKQISEKGDEAGLLRSSADMTESQAEENVFGITHAEAGYLLAEHWLLPTVVSEAIRYHHTPELEPVPMAPTSVVFLANTFCRMDPSQLMEKIDFDERVREILNMLEMPQIALRKTLQSYGNIAAGIPTL
jgi:HD-like signal output (HDOD) protein